MNKIMEIKSCRICPCKHFNSAANSFFCTYVLGFNFCIDRYILEGGIHENCGLKDKEDFVKDLIRECRSQ